MNFWMEIIFYSVGLVLLISFCYVFVYAVTLKIIGLKILRHSMADEEARRILPLGGYKIQGERRDISVFTFSDGSKLIKDGKILITYHPEWSGKMISVKAPLARKKKSIFL